MTIQNCIRVGDSTTNSTDKKNKQNKSNVNVPSFYSTTIDDTKHNIEQMAIMVYMTT